ncbi:serine hydrolase [Sphingobacterium corticis]|uniref:Serine hydrolase n=1 Tax=Sphingobacterium corticis TaxID=1812823 RepID=A0ABW5NP76_9SPHI
MHQTFAFIFLLLIAPIFTTKAQSADERLNRAVYNRIEYFFNSQQPDSIYNLASDSFKDQISQEQLSGTLQQLYALGTIRNAELVKFEKGMAGYRLDFDTERLMLVLGVDSTHHFHSILFQQYKEQTPKAEEEKSVEQKVATPVSEGETFESKIEKIAKSYTQKTNARSLSIGIIHQGQIQTFFFGETDDGNETLPTENSVYEIGSITKTFTATLLADLVEKQIVSLDDSITKFLPDSLAQNPDLQKITFRSLANHTSGLPGLPDNFTKVNGYKRTDPYATYDRKALFAYLKNVKLEHDPETEYVYSNLGFGLLGELISIISKKPYAACVKELIALPLHMRTTDITIDPKNENILKVFKDGEEVPKWSFQALAGAGALKSTLNDMLRYAITQLAVPENDIQRAMSATKLFTFFIPPNMDIGLGWHTNLLEDISYYWHNGATAGSYSYIGLIPDERSAVVILSNSNVPLDDTAQEIIRQVIKKK